MNDPERRLSIREIYKIVTQRIEECRKENPDTPSCGRPKEFPCWLDVLIPQRAHDPVLRSSPFCSGCLAAEPQGFRYCYQGGCYTARALYEAGVPPEAANLLDHLMNAHDEPGNEYKNMMVDALNNHRQGRYGGFDAAQEEQQQG